MRIPISRLESPSRKQTVREGDSSVRPVVTTEDVEAAVLYVVGAPIGNPEDITLRALRVLQHVSMIAAEDRKRTEALLACYGIETRVETLQRREQRDPWTVWISRLRAGDSLALLSDAGMPCIADPGQKLVEAVISAGFRVTVVPGANAALAALLVSGLPAGQFVFLNFPPRPRTARAAFFAQLAGISTTMVLYESRRYLLHTVRDLRHSLGPERRIGVACDLTKPSESVLRGELGAIEALLGRLPAQAEYTLVIAGSPRE